TGPAAPAAAPPATMAPAVTVGSPAVPPKPQMRVPLVGKVFSTRSSPPPDSVTPQPAFWLTVLFCRVKRNDVLPVTWLRWTSIPPPAVLPEPVTEKAAFLVPPAAASGVPLPVTLALARV